ncbi:MAG: hypothetical protein V2B19_25950 [Pseudomonadota bacterium]
MSDSEFLPVWKKYPGVAGTMIKAGVLGKRKGFSVKTATPAAGRCLFKKLILSGL